MATTFVPLSELSLFPATPDQVLESRRRHAPQWCRKLSIEEYLLRDQLMDGHEHASDNKFITWVLAPRANPTTLDFMCSCETFRRTAVVAHPSDPSGAKQVTAYAIASVFTPPEKRKKGYAQYMMRLLHWVVAPRSALPVFPDGWGSPTEVPEGLGLQSAQFSVLYSDVGKEFYQSCGPIAEPGGGWLASGAVETSWYADKAPSGTTTGPTSPHIWLSEDDAKHVWSLDVPFMRADISETAKSSGHTAFSFLPNKGVGAFVVQRTMSFTADDAPVLPLDTWGVLLLPSAVVGVDEVFADLDKQPTYATWTLDTSSESSRVLVTTRVRASRETLPGLLEVLVHFARKENIQKIEIWGLPETLQAAASESDWETSARTDHLSAFKWYGKEGENEVEWAFNEKYVLTFMASISQNLR
ncbi:uncharacterized protein B0H18DRAFT_932906 [Fomitopsis serialis]|uniref:uncharacterized protein n=1 Tax=Fomitopsis serialis TaxID=139415 RepID=UPI002007CDF4|nr:uncharacterized protein B0H18DRAFT_932906 [Neoantrodia serialis]KAH9926718.1 hypothetical protein B0H18DRAFT_932906 [Neoantrodia serialis]